MCAIVGTTRSHVTALEMLQAVKHRGPDSRAYNSFGDFHLGFARLAITGHTQEADIYNQDGDWLLFNGEIFGYPREQFKTDTEYLFSLLRNWYRPDLGMAPYPPFPPLHGQYAFAYFNAQYQTLFLGRDFFGERPLYYHINSVSQELSFASEAKALIPLVKNPHVDYEDIGFLETRSLDLSDLPDLSYGICSGSNVTGISAVPANHILQFKKRAGGWVPNGFQRISRSKWHVPVSSQSIGDLLYNAVVERSDHGNHEIGAYLSGGLDSALICCIARPKHVYTCVFDTDIGKREYEFASKIARRIGAVHHVVKPVVTAEAVAHTVYYTDGPLATQSPVADFALAAEASKHVKAVLTGQGADELFCGYFRDLLFYNDMLLRQRYPRYWPLMDYYHGGARELKDDTRSGLLSSAFLHLLARGPIPKWASDVGKHLAMTSGSICAFITQMEVAFTLPSLVTMNDRATGAAGIEARSPFLDDELYTGALALPDDQKISFNGRQWVTKRAIRDIARGIVPDDIIDCEEKVGLHVPMTGLFQFTYGDLRGAYSRADYSDFCKDVWRRVVENNGDFNAIQSRRPD